MSLEMHSWSDVLSLPRDEVVFLLAMLSCYPLSFLHRRCSTPATKQWFALTMGLLIMAIALGWTMISPIFSAVVCYAIMYFAPRPVQHKVVFGFSMFYLLFCHVLREQTYWRERAYEFTSAQMLLTLKLTAVAFNYRDGAPENLKKLNKESRALCIETFPPPLAYFSHMFYFNGFLCGPSYEYNHFMSYCDMSLFKAHGFRTIPFSLSALLQKLGWIFVAAILMGVGFNVFPLSFLRTDAFFECSFLSRLLIVWVSGWLYRYKYFFVWFLAEGAMLVAGFSFNGVDETSKQIRWDGVIASRVWKVDWGMNMHIMVDSWNISVNTWLRRYVYERVQTHRVSSGRALVITWMISAFWHGYFPGYYITFLMAALLTMGGRLSRRIVRPYFLDEKGNGIQPYKAIYDVVGWMTASLCLHYAVLPFLLMDLTGGVLVWKSLYFSGNILSLVWVVCLSKVQWKKKPHVKSA